MRRNQGFLYALGLLDRLNDMGGQMSRLVVHAYGKCLGPRTMHLKEAPFSDIVLCGQHNFEQTMARELKRLQVSIEFNTKLIDATQYEDRVVARMVKDDKEEKSEFAYMIGCDGGRGTSRRFTNLDFEITKTGVAIRQVDCRLQWRRLSTMDQMWLFYFDHGFAVVIPLPGGVHRVLCIEPKLAFPARDPTLAEMQAKLRLVADDSSLVLSDAEWYSYTDLSMGIAPAMQDGYIILAGDVSNPVLPNGGQGMNTGITDAFNLGWKLAAVLRNNAPRSLLHTYNTERHAVHSDLQKAQFNSLRYTTLVTPKIMQMAFRWLVEPLLNRGGEYAIAQIFSELPSILALVHWVSTPTGTGHTVDYGPVTVPSTRLSCVALLACNYTRSSTAVGGRCLCSPAVGTIKQLTPCTRCYRRCIHDDQTSRRISSRPRSSPK